MLILMLCITEAVLRIISPDTCLTTRTYPDTEIALNHQEPTFSSYFRHHDSLGWVCTTGDHFGFANRITKQPAKFYHINHQGFRNPFDFDSVDTSTNLRRILLIGDSFIFSLFLNEDQSIRQLIQDSLGSAYLCINLGIPGFGFGQSSLSMYQYVHQLKPDLVIHLYIDEDIRRVLESRQILLEEFSKPSFSVKHGKLVERRDGKSWVVKGLESSYILNRFYKRYLEKEQIQIAERFITINCEMLTANKGKYLLFRCPTLTDKQQNTNIFGHTIGSLIDANGHQYVDLYDQMKHSHKSFDGFFLQGDGHPSSKGARLIASNITKAIKFHYAEVNNE